MRREAQLEVPAALQKIMLGVLRSPISWGTQLAYGD